jgi:hypothetical protein
MGEWLYSIQVSVFITELIAAAVKDLLAQDNLCAKAFEQTGCTIGDDEVKQQGLELT